MSNQLDLSLGDPVVVAVSEPGETRWGFHQFPELSRLPTRELLLTFNVCPDVDADYGRPGPAFVSSDEGETWEPYDGDETMATVSHSPISEVRDGEFLCVPLPMSVPVKDFALPPPVCEYVCYFPRKLYRYDQCPRELREYYSHLDATRWSPKTGTWQRERIAYDPADALIRQNGPTMVRPSFQYPLTQSRGELFMGNYVSCYVGRDGSIPGTHSVYCMASGDNGRTFERRGTIAADPEGQYPMSETAIAETSSGELVAAIRSTAAGQKPLWISRSSDAGWTWSAPERLFDFGVKPTLLRLENGVLVLSFGRPGVYLSFSLDGTAQSWTEPTPIIAGDHESIAAHSCGYTALLELASDEFLLAYSDFQHLDGEGRSCRAIVARRMRARG